MAPRSENDLGAILVSNASVARQVAILTLLSTDASLTGNWIEAPRARGLGIEFQFWVPATCPERQSWSRYGSGPSLA